MMVRTMWLKTEADGRLQVPAELLHAAGLAGGEPVCVVASEKGIEILSQRTALSRAHDIARQFVPDGASLADELIAERRREAAMEVDDA